MSFSHSSRTIKSGKTYMQAICLNMTLNVKNLNKASKSFDNEENNISDDRISPELIEERISENLEAFKEQFSYTTQLLNQLVYDNSAKTTPTEGPRAHRPTMMYTGEPVVLLFGVIVTELFNISVRRFRLGLVYWYSVSSDHFKCGQYLNYFFR